MVEQTVVTEETKTEEVTVSEVKKKKSGWGIFLNFLMYGGWLLILLIGVVLAIVISLMTAPPKPG